MKLTWEYETAAHQRLLLDTPLTGAAIERVLDPHAPRPDREEAELLALLLRGHLALLVPEMTEALKRVQRDETLCAGARRALAEAEHLLATPPIYTARGTAAVVPLAHCCRDLHCHLTAAAGPHGTP